MKRGTFLASISALFATPAMPVAATAVPASVTQHFATAKLLARCHDRASPEMFARLMKLDTDTAKGVFNLLQDKGVIGNGIDGITRAMNPLNTHCVPNEAVRARDMAQMSSDIARKLREMAKRRLEKMQDAQPDDEPEAPEPDISELSHDGCAQRPLG